jgi:hypothetical protein
MIIDYLLKCWLSAIGSTKVLVDNLISTPYSLNNGESERLLATNMSRENLARLIKGKNNGLMNPDSYL